MRKRFSTPIPLHPPDPAAELPPPDESTHRYFSNALADIRSAIAQARGEDAAPEAPVPDAVRSWSAELPPMATTEADGLTEVTQRYADQSVAGIRAAIAAARESGSQDPSSRAPARFAHVDPQHVKVPSLVLEVRDETAHQPETPAKAPEEGTP